MSDLSDDYGYHESGLNDSHEYLLPKILEIINEAKHKKPGTLKIFEIGCGNGSIANELYKQGVSVSGIDGSASGIKLANENYPYLNLEVGSAYDNLETKYGKFPVVLSLEVIEHLYFPRKFAAAAYGLLDHDGIAIISTPYHGYWKNLALALTGKMDAHFTALWDGGHIKFWSIKTITALLRETGVMDIEIYKVGRIPFLAKSMIVVARKP
jgi:2-polyprenyl-3-methyl-5-hydroxy-6-metoxy-1,4-benzoquinol methylase